MSVKQLILLTGDSGDGKSSLLGTAIVWHYKKTGKKARIYTADGGKATLQYLVDAGWAEQWDLGNRIFPFETVRKVAEGYWPEEPDNPNTKLMAPFVHSYSGACPKCKTVGYGPAEKPMVQGAVCAKCPVPKPPLISSVERKANPKNDLSKIGIICHEGLTAYSECFLSGIAGRIANGEKLGEEVPIRFKENDVAVGAPNRGGYMAAQRRIKDAVDASRNVPVDYVIWTALKNRGEERETGASIFGPKLAGNAATYDALRWFGPRLVITQWPVQGKDPERRLYLSSFYGEEMREKGVKHIADARIPPIALGGVPKYMVYEQNDATLLGKVIELIEERQAKAIEIVKGMKGKGA